MRLLNDEKIWSVLNTEWEAEQSGQTSITYPDDPNILQSRAVAKAQFNQDREWVKEYLEKHNRNKPEPYRGLNLSRQDYQILLKQLGEE